MLLSFTKEKIMKIKTLQGLMTLMLVAVTPLASAIPAEERAALIAIYDSTDGDNWRDHTGWLGEEGSECDWRGVHCDVTKSYVSSLEFTYYLTNGVYTGLGLKGEIPSKLGQLTQLKTLDFSNNELTGSIPAELRKLTQLKTLDFSSNKLTGSVPEELGQLTQLENLSLSNNELTGSIPVELRQMTKLKGLYLIGNQLIGHIPHELGQLTQLEDLSLAGNQLTGSIPHELGQLTQLKRLDFEKNQLTGNIPAELGGLSQLDRLYLGKNQLTGDIPVELAQLPLKGFLNTFSLSWELGLDLNDNCLSVNDPTLRTFLNRGTNTPFAWKEQRTDCSLSAFDEQAVAIYEASGLLTLHDVFVDNEHLSVELQDQGNYQFLITSIVKLSEKTHNTPVRYNSNSLIATIPSVTAFGKRYVMQLKMNEAGLFGLLQATEY
jgi:Leucine-rich repeat (LRR) protein